MSLFQRSPIEELKNGLDYLAVRQKVVGSNVANVNTPGYKTRDISFDALLESKQNALSINLTRTNERHFPKVGEDNDSPATFLAYESYGNAHDGNNDVDIDKEMLKIGEIQTSFNIFSEMLIRKYNSMKNVIAGTV